MTDAKTIATYDAKAADYANLVKSDAPDASLRAFMGSLHPGARVLDLGCGPGTASAHMRDAGLVPDPVDASPNMIKIASETFGLYARVATFDDITGSAVYDGVWANFSLLHAERSDLPKHLRNIADALIAGGIFHIGMKTGTGMERDAIDRRYTYVTVTELRKLLTDAGFVVTHTKTGEERGMAGTMDPFVIMRATKAGDA
ncbi:MAG: class I SAM-dependent methyltransferase [Pseudomonadota bacterium]